SGFANPAPRLPRPVERWHRNAERLHVLSASAAIARAAFERVEQFGAMLRAEVLKRRRIFFYFNFQNGQPSSSGSVSIGAGLGASIGALPSFATNARIALRGVRPEAETISIFALVTFPLDFTRSMLAIQTWPLYALVKLMLRDSISAKASAAVIIKTPPQS